MIPADNKIVESNVAIEARAKKIKTTATRKIFNLTPQAKAIGTFDYSSEFPDGMLKNSKPLAAQSKLTRDMVDSISRERKTPEIESTPEVPVQTVEVGEETEFKEPEVVIEIRARDTESNDPTISVSLSPDGKAIVTYDYSGKVPDAMLKNSKPIAVQPTPSRDIAVAESEETENSQLETLIEKPASTVDAGADSTTNNSETNIEAQETASNISVETTIEESETTIENPAQPAMIKAPPDNVWERIRSGYQLESLDNKIVRKYEVFYSKNPKTMERIIDRAKDYLPYIVSEVERRGLPLELALLPVVESAYNPRAYSRAGAAGLWQFMPYTGKQYGLVQNWWYEGRRDIVASTDAALRHLYDLSVVFDNDWHLALAAYNAGMYGVQKAIKKNRKRNKPTDYSSLSLLRETRHFVPKLIAIRNIVSDPEAFGLTLPYLPMVPQFEMVHFDFQVDLGIVASQTRIQEYQLAKLNPGLRRTVTPPEGPHRILVPSSNYRDVLNWKSSLRPSHAVTTVLHTVKSGDVLGTIAEKYNVSISAIKSVNSMSSSLIRIGQRLRIPTPASLARGNVRINADGDIIYRVKRGDTLSTIGQRYDVSVATLKSVNLLYSDLIRVNQKLQIPTPGSRSVHGKIVETPVQDKPKQNQRTIIHDVVSGDTLYRIAMTYGISVAKLRVSNSLSSDHIEVGQKLKVPVSGSQSSAAISTAEQKSLSSATRYVYTVRQGDTLWRIAQIHQTKVSNLMEWNDIGQNYRIEAGQKIIIFVD